jgi:hypothetical protein
MYIHSLWLFRNWNCNAGSGRFGRCGLLHWNVIPMGRAVVAGASGICAMVLICMYCACTCICIYLCVSMYIYMYRYVFVYHVRGRNCGKLRKKKVLSAPSVATEISCLFIPPSPKGEGVYCFTSVRLSVRRSSRMSVLSSVQYMFRRIFFSNCWWQKSYIWSQASYRYAILWVSSLDPSDSYFLFGDFFGFL